MILLTVCLTVILVSELPLSLKVIFAYKQFKVIFAYKQFMFVNTGETRMT